MGVHLTELQQVAVAVEAVAGTNESLVGGDVLLHTGPAEFEPLVPTVERRAMSGTLSKRGSIRSTLGGIIRWKQFLRGTSGAPVAGSNEMDCSAALKGCGLALTVSGTDPNEQSSYKFSDTTISDETNGAYCTVQLIRDGKQYLIYGAVGNCKLSFIVGEPVLAEFEFQGLLLDAPGDVSFLVPTNLGVPTEPIFVAAASTVLGYANARFKTLTIDFGNRISFRPDPNGAEGFHTAQIVDRKPVGTIDPEEALTTDKDWWSAFLNGDTGTITTGEFPSIGDEYNQFNAIMTGKITKPTPVDRDGIDTTALEFEVITETDGGQDEFELIQS